MKAFLWRIVYAALTAFMFLLVFPLFMDVVGFPASGSLWQLIRICVGCLAVAYVLFFPAERTPMPF